MSPSWRRVAAVGALVGVLASGTACGKEDASGVASKNIKTLPADLVKGPVLNLAVTAEDVAEDVAGSGDSNSYIAAVGMYALRDGDKLEATLQVSKFTDKARPKEADFQNQVATQIGGTKAQRFRMGDHSVFRSSGRKQSIASWFTGNYYFVLSVRDAYPTPRTLLRKLIMEVRPND
ncbi:MAG TPA: hypothetical protein VNB24_04955 [Acidimicrobiales bacterium]|nr:hypothetical protein [Acidimicrobiales bacterium]